MSKSRVKFHGLAKLSLNYRGCEKHRGLGLGAGDSPNRCPWVGSWVQGVCKVPMKFSERPWVGGVGQVAEKKVQTNFFFKYTGSMKT